MAPTPYGLLPYTRFPSPEASLTAEGAVEDFARLMSLDELMCPVSPEVVARLDRALNAPAATAEQRAQTVVAVMRPCFEEANRALERRGAEGRWVWLYTPTRARNGVTWRWYRVSTAEREASEREGALSAASFARNLKLRTSAAVVFYALLAAGWARPSTFLHTAAGAAFVVYLLARWRLPLRPKRS